MLIPLRARSDEYVIRRVLAGRQNDFGVLVHRYLQVVTAVARGNLRISADVEDVAQESFLAAYQKLDTLRAPEKFASWLLTIARNTALNWQRSRQREVSLDQVGGVEQLQHDTPSVDHVEMQQMLHRTLMEMEPEPRELLLMHYYGGCTLREIANIRGITRDAAAKRLQRAREALGVEFLKVVPEALSRRDVKKAARKIAVAVIAAGAAWRVAPVYGAVATLAIGSAKLGSIAAGVLALLTGAFFAAPSVLGWEPNLPAAQVAEAKALVKSLAPEKMEPVSLTAAEDAIPAEEGQFPLSNVLVTPLDQAIGNARVLAERVTWPPQEIPPATTEKWATTADANGCFTFEGLPPGAYSVTATTAVFGGAHDFLIGKDGNVKGPRNIKMYPILRSYGVLQDSSGAPVAGATIYPINHELFPNQEFDHVTVCGLRASTDEQGRFRFEGIIPGAWRLYVVAPGHAPYYTGYIPCYGLRATVVIEEPGILLGRVVDASGKPVSDIKGIVYSGRRVYTYDDYQPSYRMQYAFTSNEEGVFRIESMAPGSYSFAIDDAALALVSPATKAEVRSGTEIHVDLEVGAGGSILGRVLNSKTKDPVPNAEMSAYLRDRESSVSRRLVTGANGDYIFTGLPEGTYVISVRGGNAFLPSYNREPQLVNVKLGETIEEKDILLDPALMLTGRVVDVNGNPAEAEVFARGRNQYTQEKSGVDGAFALPLKGNEKVSVVAKTATCEASRSRSLPRFRRIRKWCCGLLWCRGPVSKAWYRMQMGNRCITPCCSARRWTSRGSRRSYWGCRRPGAMARGTLGSRVCRPAAIR